MVASAARYDSVECNGGDRRVGVKLSVGSGRGSHSPRAGAPGFPDNANVSATASDVDAAAVTSTSGGFGMLGIPTRLRAGGDDGIAIGVIDVDGTVEGVGAGANARRGGGAGTNGNFTAALAVT